MNLIAYVSRLTMLCFFSLFIASAAAQQTWRGLVVEPENRCSPYNKRDQYPYPQSVEDKIVAEMGGYVYGPYTGRYFNSDTQTDIEHIVASSEGHDSGLCSSSKEKRKQFATDLLNLTLAAPQVNRCGNGGKCGFDAADWMPRENKCWFANRVVEIKTKYKLTVDKAEADALEVVLMTCESLEMVFFQKTDQYVVEALKPDSAHVLTIYDDNGNGRITCTEARAHDIAPVKQNHPAFKFMNDRDGDGVVCE